MLTTIRIPFNRPYMTGNELDHIKLAHERGQLAGDGWFSRLCAEWLERTVGSPKAILTHSCTAALELAAMLLNIAPGDEVIMPSFTFVSTANAFVLRGGIPVFIDIRHDTLNIDASLIEAAITSRTRAIVAVHYAGVACDMDAIMTIAARHGLCVVEDAAQSLLSTYKGRPLGGIGHLAALSFHETKNIMSGEGGALLVNDPALSERAEVLSEKGTDRHRFFRGQVDRYTWVDIGSSFRPGEIVAAFLWAQMQEAESITERRRALWARYQDALEPLERVGRLVRPNTASCHEGNAHLYYVLLPGLKQRTAVINRMNARGIQCVFHYTPLHDSPAGRAFTRSHGSFPNTSAVSERLLRLPMWVGLEKHQDEVIEELTVAIAELC